MVKQLLVISLLTLSVTSNANTLPIESVINSRESTNTTTPPVMINKIAAYVNKRIITQNEVDNQTRQAQINLQQYQ